MFEAVVFYIFAGVALASAIGCVLTTNIVRTAIWLLGTLGGVAGLYFLLFANLLGAIQLIVYAGGTLILIIFGVMLTSQSPWIEMKPTRGQVVMASLVAVLLVTGLITLLTGAAWPTDKPPMMESPKVAVAGTMLLTDYLVPFEVASVLLLVVMVGAAYLARPEN